MPKPNPNPGGNRGLGGSDAAPMMIDLLAWSYTLREKFWLIALGVIVCLGLATAYIVKTPRIYTAQCVLQVEQSDAKVMGKIEDINPEDLKSLESLKTIEGALESRSLLVRIVRVNRLDQSDPDFQAPSGQPALTDSDLADLMQRKIDVSLRRGTRLIDIHVDDTNPQRAAKLAKSLVDEYIRQSFEQKGEATRLANETLFKQRDDLKGRLEKSERGLQDYREKFGTMSLEEKQNLTVEKLKELNRQLQEARSQRIKLESDLPTLQKATTLGTEDLLTVESVAKNLAVQDTQKMLTQKEGEFGDLKKRYLELHPKYQQMEGQIADLRGSLERAVRKAATMGVASIEAARDTETKLAEALKEQERQGVELSRNAIPYNVLLRDTQADRALYDTVSTRVREIELSKEIEKSNVRVIQEPDIPNDPSRPKKSRILAIALAAGFILPTLGIFLQQAFNTTLRSVDDGEATLQLPSLAAVPQARGKAAKNPLVLVHQPAGREAESFRCLRTSLSLLGGGAGAGKLVLLTSAVPAEGKSYCSANYAVALAQQGLRTLLIDADLRRPGLGKFFPVNREAAGVSEVLTGKTEFADACHHTEVDKLFLMPAGTKGTNPAELLGGENFVQLLRTAAEKFERVVIDTAPINAVSDTLLIIEHVDAIVLVVRARKTPARVLLRALHLLDLANAHPAGFILNRLPARLANYYYYDEGNYSSAGVYGT